ncbi:Asp-tRNA(Asn)/Glu-tRNA(Gln) amidotransferase subunit GatA [bacterium]|nr:Asp-tRNA(Asn)/Glu-tRNA(Gln) amidotransferase subunit GatA [bacterium]
MPERPGLRESVERIRSGNFSSRELAENCLRRIEALNGKLNAFAHWDADAAKADIQDGPLAGAPYALKDNLCREGTLTTCASKILEGWISPYSGGAAARLDEAGARYLGKTNMDEFAMGSSTEYSVYGPTKNPWDSSRSAGGSSGGSAAAVASEMVPLALGTDTGGSIRQPAAFCGVVGIKPTYGRVSRSGLVAFASSLDQIGTLTRDVGDAALALESLMGQDPLDATSLGEAIPALQPELDRGVKGLKFGIPAEDQWMQLDAGPARVFQDSVDALREAGAEPVEIALPHAQHSVAAYYLIATAEASSNLARYDGLRFGPRREAETLEELLLANRSQGFGAEVKRRILLGTFALSAGYVEAYYQRAQKTRTLIRNDFQKAFETVDFMVIPTTPTAAFHLGEKSDDPLSMYLSDIYTLPASLAGLPAASVPCGLDAGLPLGTQIWAKTLDEAMLIRAAASLERAFPFGEIRRAALASLVEAS